MEGIIKMSTEISVAQPQQTSMQSYCFANAVAFEAAQRMAKMMSQATLVPKEYQNNIPNCVIALEIAHRMQASPTMVMQNLYIVHGKPSWSSQFIISAVNSCGKFKPLRFDFTGTENTDERSCVAWTTEKNIDIPKLVYTRIEDAATKGKRLSLLEACKEMGLPILEGPKISISIAKKEGWFGKSGSKWQTMPELMLHYRSASFFGKLYAPEILMGMQTQEEAEDIAPVRDVTPRNNSSLRDAFLNNEITESSDNVVTTNKMDEILSRPKSELSSIINSHDKEEIDVTNNSISEIASLKADEIISLIQATENIKDIDIIMKENNSHMLAMDDSLKNMIWVTREEKLKILKG